MKLFYTLLSFILISNLSFGQILTYDFSGLAGNEATAPSNFNDPSISPTIISRGTGLTASNNGNRFNATNWALTNIGNAVSGNDYMEFIITPNAGCNFSITSVVLQLQRSNTGPREIALRSSVDGYVTNLGGAQLITDNTSTQNFTFTFAHNAITTATTYRIYMWAESTGGSGGIGDGAGNDLIINGSTSCSTNTITTGTLSGAPFTADCGNTTGTSGSIDFTSVGTFNAPNIYTVELSDATGSFASPIAIGTLTSTANSGNIPFTIPSSTITGTGYLIRIVSDDPATISNSTAAITITQTNPCGITTGTVTGAPFSVDCNGTNDAGTVAFTSAGTFNAGNIYSVELSDAVGSFASPTIIGTLSSTANSGTINITIPAATATGSGYLVRIISDNPIMIGTNSAAFTITQIGTCTAPLPSSQGLLINEWSNGPSGSKEYYEFVVAGQCGDLVDIRGYILDDNNGTFSTVFPSSSGIAAGHLRLTNNAQWASIPVGSLIVIYNANDLNPLVPADDINDTSPVDSLYVIPHNNTTLFEITVTLPSNAVPDSTYTPVTYGSGLWNPLGLRNSGDAIQVRAPDGTYWHGISYGGAEMSGGPNNMKISTANMGGNVGWFSNGDYLDVTNWSTGAVAGNETPGLPNNALNLAWLRAMRDSLNATCPVVTPLPVELSNFSGHNEAEINILYWATLSEINASYFTLERSIDGKVWEELTIINASGNSQQKVEYSFVDDRYPKEINYYRLSQTDYDGTINKYNKFVVIDNRIKIDKKLVQIVNLLGQEVKSDFSGVQIHVYDDGTSEKIFHQ